MKIIVIDDDPTLLITLKAMLADGGHEVIANQSGRDALMLLDSDLLSEVDLIITDIVMPDIDGFEFVERLKKAKINKPIIIMSGGGGKLSAGNIMAIARNVADYVLPKPFTLEELNAALENVMKDQKGSSDV